jgi:hypothetical protein
MLAATGLGHIPPLDPEDHLRPVRLDERGRTSGHGWDHAGLPSRVASIDGRRRRTADGAKADEALGRANGAGSFSSDMLRNLVSVLDQIGLGRRNVSGCRVALWLEEPG